MPNWSGTVLTAKGRALQAKVESGAAMNITKLKIGDGILGAGQAVDKLNDLVAPKKIVDISTLTPLESGVCKIHGVVTNEGLETGFYVRELGVFAQDSVLGEILYAYTADGAPDFLPATGGSVAVSEELVINLAFSNAASITANIAMDGLITANILQQHNNDETAHTELMIAHNTSTTAHADLLHLRQNTTAYAIGDIAYSPTLPSWARLECVVAGTTAAVDPAWPAVGSTVTDGTVTWKVYDIRQGATIGRLPALVDVGSGVAGLPAISGKLLTDIVLSSAFTGTNQSLTANGWQKLPGGLILQWGKTASTGANTSIVVTLPIAFPAAALMGLATVNGANTQTTASVTSISQTQITIYNDDVEPGATTSPVYYFAIGY